MSGTAEDGSRAKPGLALLNTAERTVLDMLARGHTAKSIARSTGQTENAVNERLRSARRKSGVGSSRELARLLQQKSWAQEIGDEARSPPPAGEPRPVRRRAGFILGGALLMSLAIALTAALLFQPAAQPSVVLGAKPDDPLLGAILSPEEPATALRASYLRVRTEPRDDAWAGPAEAALRAAYARLPNVGAAAEAFRVICASSLCEVAGPLDANSEPQVQSIQSSAIEDAARAVSLTRVSNVFGPALENRKQTIFATYWKRTPG